MCVLVDKNLYLTEGYVLWLACITMKAVQYINECWICTDAIGEVQIQEVVGSVTAQLMEKVFAMVFKVHVLSK